MHSGGFSDLNLIGPVTVTELPWGRFNVCHGWVRSERARFKVIL